VTGLGGNSPGLMPEEVSSIVLDALYRLATVDGLTTREIAVRCILTGTVPTAPAYSRDVIHTYQTLEQAITRGTVTA
jgi:hypothetical protein